MTELTVTLNFSTAVSVPESVTVRVISAVPYWFAAGITLTFRSDPVGFASGEVTMMFATGKSVVLLLATLTTSPLSASSSSVTEKERFPVPSGASSSMPVTSAMVVIVGASFTGVTVTMTFAEDSNPS